MSPIRFFFFKRLSSVATSSSFVFPGLPPLVVIYQQQQTENPQMDIWDEWTVLDYLFDKNHMKYDYISEQKITSSFILHNREEKTML